MNVYCFGNSTLIYYIFFNILLLTVERKNKYLFKYNLIYSQINTEAISEQDNVLTMHIYL